MPPGKTREELATFLNSKIVSKRFEQGFETPNLNTPIFLWRSLDPGVCQPHADVVRGTFASCPPCNNLDCIDKRPSVC